MFEVKCKTDHDTLYLATTYNGYQWTSINIKDPEHEIPLIIEALHHQLTMKPRLRGGICPICKKCFETWP